MLSARSNLNNCQSKPSRHTLPQRLSILYAIIQDDTGLSKHDKQTRHSFNNSQYRRQAACNLDHTYSHCWGGLVIVKWLSLVGKTKGLNDDKIMVLFQIDVYRYSKILAGKMNTLDVKCKRRNLNNCQSKQAKQTYTTSTTINTICYHSRRHSFKNCQNI